MGYSWPGRLGPIASTFLPSDGCVPVLLPEVPENPVLVVDDPVVELLVVPELDVV